MSTAFIAELFSETEAHPCPLIHLAGCALRLRLVRASGAAHPRWCLQH